MGGNGDVFKKKNVGKWGQLCMSSTKDLLLVPHGGGGGELSKVFEEKWAEIGGNGGVFFRRPVIYLTPLGGHVG